MRQGEARQGSSTTTIPLCEPYIVGREAEYVAEALAAGEVGAGPFVTRFEDSVRAYTGARYAVATSSGTAALHVALLLAGVRPGDDVIVPATTFIATARAVQMCGATPVIVDVEPWGWGLGAQKLLGFLEKSRPRAIISVHLYGHPVSADVGDIAYDRDIGVVEDAAESLGAVAHGERVGSRGLACLSFNANKLITTGGGGMILTDDIGKEAMARYLIGHARCPADYSIYEAVGWNYRMPNVNAAIGLAQMETIEQRLASKRETHDHYAAELPGVFHEQLWARSSYWLTTMLLPDALTKQRVMAALAERGIESRSVWRPLHRQPGLGGCPTYLTGVADDLYARGLCLPSGCGISAKEREQVIASVKGCL